MSAAHCEANDIERLRTAYPIMEFARPQLGLPDVFPGSRSSDYAED